MKTLLAAVLAVNLGHLDWLRRDVPRADGPTLATWQIYATPVKKGDTKGPYKFVGDEDEGVGCVDDVARAAIVYAREFQRTGNPKAESQARAALAFTRALYAGEGTYYNFIWADGSLNTDGLTSKPGYNWWTARALWALAEGAKAFKQSDPAYAAGLRLAAFETVDALVSQLDAHDGQRHTYGTLSVPNWLMGDAPDVTSVAMLGLAALHTAEPDARTYRLISRYGAGIAGWTPGTGDLAGAHLPSLGPTHWHAYGAHMLHALVAGGQAIGDASLIAAAKSEADRFTPHLLVSGGPLNGFFPAPVPYAQIAYGVETQVLGLLALADATGEARYATLAALFGSWLTPMYDPATGRVSDGLDAKGPNADSGAESTIEGLLTIQALAARPDLAPWVAARETARHGVKFWEAETAPDALKLRTPGFSGDAAALLVPGRSLTLAGRVPAGRYLLTPVVRRERFFRGEHASLTLTAGSTAALAGAVNAAIRTRLVPRHKPVTDARPVLWPPEGAPWPAPEALVGTRTFLLGGPSAVRVTYAGKQDLRLDGITVQPEVEWRTFATPRGPVGVVVNRGTSTRTVRVPGFARAVTLAPSASLLLGAVAPRSQP